MGAFRPFVLLFFALLALCSPASVFAHGAGFTTFLSTTTEGYIIDIDWESLTFEAGVSGTWAFRLYQDTTWAEEVPYRDLWVRIIRNDGSPQGKTIFAGPIAQPEFGNPRFLYVFPEEGKYTLAVRYNRPEGAPQNLPDITAEFPFAVADNAGDSQPNTLNFALGAAAGAAAALVLGYLILRFKKWR